MPRGGRIASLTFLAAVDDVNRFGSSRELAGYSGLAPTVRSSGERTEYGAISREGREELRAVWLQLADAVSNDRTFSRCRECQKWLAVGPEVARSNRRFCSNACRTRSYRERQDRARRLRTEGKSFEEIATQLDSDLATIRRWITGFRE